MILRQNGNGLESLYEEQKEYFKGHRSDLKATQRQTGGNHYKKLKYQVSEFILGNNLNWIDGNIVKYAVRNKKGEY